MASQQDIKRRIRSVRNTRKITKAMELVAAAKLRRAQTRVEALRPYADRQWELVMEAAGRSNVHGEPLLYRREPEKVAVLVLSGDRGLSGAFNSQVVRRSLQLLREQQGEGHEVVWYVVGRKGRGTLRFRGIEVSADWTGFTDQPRYAHADEIAEQLADGYRDKEFDLVLLVYNHFESALTQRVQVDQLLPIPEGRLADLSPRERAQEGVLLFEPDAEDLLDQLLRDSLAIAIYRALLESAASKHGAQMTAMGNASKNANGLIDSYTLAMNRARQAEITQEILEVVAGAEALE
jgi:F-type H+-transporting ATPase subunit gamma